MNTKTKGVIALISLVILGSLLVAASPDLQSSTRFRSIFVRGNADIDGTLDVDGTSNLDVTDIDGAVDMASTLDVTGASTYASTLGVTGDTTLSADLIVDDTLNIDDTDSVLTGAQTITPTYSYLQVSPTAVLTITLGVPSACDGDLLIVHNLVSTSTTIVDTGATAGGGNITLGQDDLAGLICGDSVWVEMFSPDNS